MRRDRQDAGGGSQSDDADEEQAEYESVDRAQHVEHALGAPGQGPRSMQIARGQKSERQRQQCRQHRTERRDAQRRPQGPADAAQVAVLRGRLVLDAQYPPIAVSHLKVGIAEPDAQKAGLRHLGHGPVQVLPGSAAQSEFIFRRQRP